MMFKNFSINLISRAIFVVSSFFMHLALARILGPEMYGNFGLCISIVMFAHIFTNNGVRQQVCKRISQEPQKTRSIYLKGLKIQSAICLFLLLFIYFGSKQIAQYFQAESATAALKLCALAVFFQGIVIVYSAVLIGRKKFALEAIVAGIGAILRGLLPVLFAIFYFDDKIRGAIFGLFLTNFLTWIAFLKVSYPLLNKKESSSFKIEIPIKETALLLILFGIITILRYSDLLFVKRLLSPEFAGFYNASLSLSQGAYLFMLSLGVTIFPYVSQSAHHKDTATLSTQTERMLCISTSILVPILLFVSIFSKEIIEIAYGTQYAQSQLVLKTIIFSCFFLGRFYALSQVFIAINELKKILFIAIFVFVFNLLINYHFITNYGFFAVSVSQLISCFLAFLLSFFLLQNQLKLSSKILSKELLLITACYLINSLEFVCALGIIARLIVLIASFLVLFFSLSIISSKEMQKIKNKLIVLLKVR